MPRSLRAWTPLPPAALAALLGLVTGPLQAQQIRPLVAGGVEVTPDDGVTPYRAPNEVHSVLFTVKNTGTFQYTFDLACGRSGTVSSCENDLEVLTLGAGASANVAVSYSTGGLTGAGTVTLTASRTGMSDQGSYTITVAPTGDVVPWLLRPNLDHLDRGRCFTVGAGEAAGLSCGDLFLTHAMPAYVTMGRDRSLALHYNSATATGLTLVPLWFRLPHTIGRPSQIRVVLDVTVPPATSRKDSTTYTVPALPACGYSCSDSFQVVVGRSLAWDSIPSGYYPITVSVRTLYQNTATTTTRSGHVLVANRSASEYGRGWGLLGVEQVLIPPQDTTVRVWAAGDGSMRTYHRGAGVVAAQLSASGLTGFSAASSVDSNLVAAAWSTSGSTATGAYVRADLGPAFPQAVTSARLYATTPSNATYAVEYSADNSAWTTAVASFRPQQGWSSVVWSSVGASRFWRLRVTSNNGVGSTISELSFGAAHTFYAAPGGAPDSLVRFDTLGVKWYRRPLRHGANVTFDATGRHRVTTNRVGARTVLTDTILSGGQIRLRRITVPPDSGSPRSYTLSWSGATGLLDSISDPGGRGLRAGISGGRLVKLRDPGGLDSTRFGYDGRGVLTLRSATTQRNSTMGDSATTRFTYGNTLRVTRVALQADSAGNDSAATVVTPWDEYGLTSLARVDTAGYATRIDGPLPGIDDAIDVRVDRFGQLRRLNHVGLQTVTLVKRDSVNSLPALPTEVRSPHPTNANAVGLITRLSWNLRGSLVEQRDSSSHLGAIGQATRYTRYSYSDADAPDSPSRVEDALGRHVDYAYNGLGLTELITDPRGHQTAFDYVMTGALKGQMLAVTDSAVMAWRQSDSAEVLNHLRTSLAYDANGNLSRVIAPDSTVTSYAFDGLGRLTDIFHPDSSRSGQRFDALNRVTSAVTYTIAQPHPGNPTLSCRAQYLTCAASPWDMDPGPDSLTTRFYHGPSGLDSVVDPRGVQRAYRYDARGATIRELDEYGAAKTATYSTPGLLASTKSRLGALQNKSVTYFYDAFGRDTAVIYPAMHQDSTPGDTIRTTYDRLGRKLVVRSRLSTIRRSYYADGSVRSRLDSLAGERDSLAYQYDATGARVAMYHAYRADPAVVDSVRYHYGAATGDLDSLSAWWATDSASYAGRRVVRFAWDSLGRRRRITYPAAVDSMKVRYAYDLRGALRLVADTNPGDPEPGLPDHFDFLWKTREVDVMGRPLSQLFQCSPLGDYAHGTGLCQGVAANRITTTNVYSRRGMLTRQHRPELPTALRHDTLAYDESGNMIRRRGHVFVVQVGKNRLLWDSLLGANQTVSFTYDADGSRRSELGVDAVNRRHHYYDGLGRVSGTAAYKEASNGQFNWTPYAPACEYNAEGQLAKPCDGTDRLFFDGENTVRASTGNTSIWHFVSAPGLDEPLIGFLRKPAGTPRVRELFYVGDGRGRLLAVADSAGELEEPLHTAYGLQGWQYAGGTANAQSFDASRMANADRRPLSFFRHRAYDPATGRWTQEDPIGIAGGLNLYQFSGNNPASYTDPFGLCPCVVAAAPVLAGGGGAVAVKVAVAGAIIGGAAWAGAKWGQITSWAREKTDKLRKAWEGLHGTPWPTTTEGKPYEADHDIPLADGGDDTADNITPRTHDDHVQRHKDRGDFRRWGRRGAPKRSEPETPPEQGGTEP